MSVRLEHANMSVRDIDVMIRFLQAAFPEFRVRGKGTSANGTRWVHVGADETYIARLPGVPIRRVDAGPGKFLPRSLLDLHRPEVECLWPNSQGSQGFLVKDVPSEGGR